MLNIPTYTPQNWFWVVNGDTSRAWSSASSAYVADYPADTLTRIESEAALSDVLRPYGLVGPSPAQQDYATAIQTHVDNAAKARGYADGSGLAGYSSSTVPAWSAEAQAFIAWRDAVWVYAYTELAKVQGGQRAVPTVDGLIAELPAIKWPGAF